jgi:hypothetical protein
LIIVIEGPDLAGKTTFAHAFGAAHQERHPQGTYRIMKASAPDPPDRDPLAEYEGGLALLAEGGELRKAGHLIILDRWCLGEEVYGPLMRGGSRFTPGGILHAEMCLSALGAMKVTLLPPVATLLSRYLMRGDDVASEDDLPKLHALFGEVSPRYGYQVVRVDVTDMALHGKLARCEAGCAFAAKIQDAAPGYVGSLLPGVIFAGDVRSGSIREVEPPAWRPAFAPAGGSARFLMDALAQRPAEVAKAAGLLNTGEDGMSLELADELLRRPLWVAPGREAYRRLNLASVKCRYVPHPQWARRFDHGGQKEYGECLLKTGELW